jgi:hypothetical protein
MDERSAHADEYRRRRDVRHAQVAAAERRSQALSYARVAAFALAVGTIWAATTHRAPTIMVTAPFALFVALVIVHDRADRTRKQALRAVDYWERGLLRMDERHVSRGDGGERFLDDAHPYARDLDLFGKDSLFELLCTARTRAGEETLARWLLAPATADEVRARQAAVLELRARLDLREALALAGEDVRAEVDPDGLSRWGAAAPLLSGIAPWIGVFVLSLASLATLGVWIVGLDWRAFAVAQAVVALVMRAFKSRVAKVNGGVDRPGRDLAVLAHVIALFERERFTSARLVEVSERLGGGTASRRIARLATLVDWANWYRNQFFTPLGWILLWPVHFAFAIERWRVRSGRDVARWLEAIGELEALAAMAGYAYERPDEVFPEIVDGNGGPRLVAEELGHPLIPRARCVRNNLSFGAELRLLIVSGSNMSGKSTMLRTVGLNVVLALAGAPVRARSLSLSPLRPGATLRIQDSLAEGASRFYAEITRLKQLVDLSRGAPPLLFLLDEILAGTNSHDRRIGAEAVVRGLVEHGAIGLCTTHDLALAEVANALAPRARNVHFEDRMVDGKLEFDYRMRDGVVQHSNAIALMRAVGLEV